MIHFHPPFRLVMPRVGVILSGWAKLSPKLLDDSQPDYKEVYCFACDKIFFGSDLPHEWLFPRCKMTVHHGGSGTTHCALRAGRPTIITPVFADQFSYRRLAVKLGVAVQADPLPRLTGGKLAAAIRKVDSKMEARAEQIGTKMRAEPGALAAVQQIEKHLHERVRTGKWKKDFQERFVAKLDRPPTPAITSKQVWPE